MKKVVRILGLCALVALAVTSCKKNENTTQMMTFKATINQPVSNDRTHIGVDNMLVWDANNAIKVLNADGVVGEFTTTDQDVVEADFTGNIPVTDTYTAFYPNAVVDGNTVTLGLSANQNYVDDNFGNDTYPMAAPSTIIGDELHFYFGSPASVLRLQLRSDNACTVKTIEVTGGANDKLAGDIVYANYNDVDTYTFANTTNTVTLDCGTGVQLAPNEVTAFNIVILNGTLSAGTNFVVKDMGGNVITTLTTSVANNVPAEVIFTMPVKEVSYALPTVTTTAATNVSYTTATINGNYTYPAGAAVTSCGFYWGTDPNNLTQQVTCPVGSPMSYNLTGLAQNTTYYFKAFAVNATGENCGEVLNFTTLLQVANPVVVTLDPEIPGTSAVIKGRLDNDGNEACTVGFYYGTDPTLNSHSTQTISGTHNSVYEFNWTWNDLAYNTHYYYRAYAVNSTGTVILGEIKEIFIYWHGHFLTNAETMHFVNFSIGLLWWDNNAGVFAFENDQYGYHRWMNDDQSINASFGQFCWSNEFNDYGKNNTPNQTGHGFKEWGENEIRMPNSNEMYPANMWRTLTYPEWECIIEHHGHLVRNRGGMNYFILLPYGMTVNEASGYNNNQLANMGAAFFPMCGNAMDDPGSGTATWGFGSQICIWSASVATDSGNWGQAGAVWFYGDGGGYINAGGMHNSYYHRMQVRLVIDEN